MNEDPPSPPPPQTARKTPLNWGALWLGLLLFGGIDFAVFLYLLDSGTAAALILIGIVVFIAGLSFVAGLRSFAAGVAGGYVLMTVVSGGACTLMFTDPLVEGDPLIGLFLYGLAIAVFGVAAVVYLVSRARSRR